MTAAVADRRNVERQDILEGVRRELVTFDHRTDASYVKTMLLYPSGAYVVLRVDGGPDRFLVSDFGMGYHEADMMGATTRFSRHARVVAENAGVGFDRHAFFVVEITRDQLPGAIVAIADCSRDAVSIAAPKLAEKSRSNATDTLYERLVGVFSRRSVSRDVEVIGSSLAKWHVATTVNLEGRTTIFEPVTPHHASIVNAVAKFHDIANLDDAPGRNAVVVRKEQFGTYLGVLTQAANVVEQSAPDDTLRSLARAA